MTSLKFVLCAGTALVFLSTPALSDDSFRAPPPPYADLKPASPSMSEAQKQDQAMKAVLVTAEDSAAMEPAAGAEKKEEDAARPEPHHAPVQEGDAAKKGKEEALKAEGRIAAAPEAPVIPKRSLPSGEDLCATGQKQSPVNIAQFRQNPDLQKLKVAYQPVPLIVANTGKSVRVIVPPGSKFASADRMYDLSYIEFHTPSEHYMDGAPYPMEMQLVHQSAQGDVAVVAVMLKLGAESPAIKKIWDNIPATEGQNTPKDVLFSATELLPMQGMYYTYEGSLTAAPCTEGVKWHVLQNPVEISEDQLRAFQALFPVNARSVQPLNGRVVEGNG